MGYQSNKIILLLKSHIIIYILEYTFDKFMLLMSILNKIDCLIYINNIFKYV